MRMITLYKTVPVFFIVLLLILSSIVINIGEKSHEERGIELVNARDNPKTRAVNNITFTNFTKGNCNSTYIDENGNIILGWQPPQNPYQEDESTKLLSHFDNIYDGEDDEAAMGVDKSCIAYYKFDEGIGTTAYDSSGKDNHGTINGATWVDGRYGKGLYLGGVVTSYVITNPINNFATTDITAMFWMKTSDTINSGTPISYASSTSDNEFFIGNYKSFTVYKDLSSKNTLISANDGLWHHIAITWENSTGRLILYKDGTLAYLYTLSVGQGITPGGSLVIGQDQDNVGGGFQASQSFLGTIDEVAIFNRNMSASEIANIYKSQFIKLQNYPNQTSIENGKFGKGVKIEKYDTLAYPIGLGADPSCVGFWKFDEGTGNTVRDSSENDNHGTWYGNASANWTDGIYGTALKFDGVDDYVDCGNDASLNNLGDFSIEAWINLPNPIDGYFKTIISKHTSDGTINNNAEFNFQVQNDGNLNFLMGNGVSAPRLDGGILKANTWYHVAVTMEGTYQAMYLNGKLVDSDFFTGTRQYGNLPVQISRYNNQAAGWQKFNGIIDEVVIYSRAKSAEEIYTDYFSKGQNNFNINEGTLELCVKSAWDGNDDKKHTIFYTGHNWKNDSFFIYKDSDNYLKFITADNQSNFQGYPRIDLSNWKVDTWYHLVFTWNSLGTKSIYINGYLMTKAFNNYMPVLSHSAINIGSTHQNYGSFEGIIDELRVSDKVRAPFEFRDFHYIGTYESQVIDAGEIVAWENISWNAYLPEKTNLYLQSRTSNDNITWSQWTGNQYPSETELKGYLDNTGEQINASPARYFQWRGVLKSSDGLYTPALHNVTITWNYLPKIYNVTISPQKPTVNDDLIINYSYSDPDGEPEDKTTFEWFADKGTGSFVSSGIKTQTLSLTWTSYNDRWFCIITPHDGNDYGLSAASQIVNITHGEITRIEITPAYVEISADENIQFGAKALDAANNKIKTSFSWNISGSGSIDQNGLFEPVDLGLHNVYAFANGIYGSAIVKVLPGKLNKITISPENSTITTDDVIDFEAKLFDTKDNIIPDLGPTWNITGGGVIDPENGTFEATMVGTYTVFANHSNITGSTKVNINPGNPDIINLTPQNPTTTADEQIQFTIEAYDKGNNTINTGIEWYAENSEITNTGLFTPEKTGEWKISVKFSNSDIEVNTTVTVLHGKVAKIILEPNEYTMSIEDEITFSTTSFDSKNNQWADIKNLTWSIDNSTLGEISQSGVFTAKQPGKVTVSAKSSSATRTNGEVIGKAFITISSDGDSDGMPDEWELQYGLDIKTNDANDDKDGDGLANIIELQYGTNPDNKDSDDDGYSDDEELEKGSDPKDKADKPEEKAAGLELMDMLLLIIIIALILIIIVLIVTRRKTKKEEAPREEEEYLWEKGEEYDEKEEIEEEEVPKEEEPEEEELEEEEPEGMERDTKPEPEIEEPAAEEEFIDFEMPEETPVKKEVPIKGKLPIKGKMPKKPMELKTKLPAEPEFGKVVKPEKINREHEFEPQLVKLEDKSVICNICLGAIKTGLMAIKCECGKHYHESCGVRLGECPRCDRKFKLERLAKIKEEELKEKEELEESELTPKEFEEHKEDKKKAERERIARLIRGIEDRLANGEISETTYLMLRKKYEK